jgi:hypothetical protein
MLTSLNQESQLNGKQEPKLFPKLDLERIRSFPALTRKIGQEIGGLSGNSFCSSS